MPLGSAPDRSSRNAPGSAPSSAAFCRGQGPPTSGPKWPFAPRERLRDDDSGPGPRNAFLQKRALSVKTSGTDRRGAAAAATVSWGRVAAPPRGATWIVRRTVDSEDPPGPIRLSSLLRSARSGDKNEKYFLVCIFSGDVSRRALREVPRFYAVASRR